MNGNPEVIEALLAAGADPMARSLEGNTPLHGGVQNFNPAVILPLLDAGADPLATNAGRRDTLGISPRKTTS